MSNPMHENDDELRARLKGALRVVVRVLDDATPEALDRLRRDEWRIEVSAHGLHILERRSDATTAAGEVLADEAAAWLESRENGD